LTKEAKASHLVNRRRRINLGRQAIRNAINGKIRTVDERKKPKNPCCLEKKGPSARDQGKWWPKEKVKLTYGKGRLIIGGAKNQQRPSSGVVRRRTLCEREPIRLVFWGGAGPAKKKKKEKKHQHTRGGYAKLAKIEGQGSTEG